MHVPCVLLSISPVPCAGRKKRYGISAIVDDGVVFVIGVITEQKLKERSGEQEENNNNNKNNMAHQHQTKR